jgi:hypothetical protein
MKGILIEGSLFIVYILINKQTNARALYNEEYSFYSLINSRFTAKHNLPRILVTPREATTYEGLASAKIEEIVYF